MTLEEVLEYYEEGLFTQGELESMLSGVLTEDNLDEAASWLRSHPEIRFTQPPARVWWSNAGVRIVLTEAQIELMQKLTTRLSGQ